MRQAWLRLWWMWVISACLAYAGTIAGLRWLLNDYIVISVVHDAEAARAGRVVLYFSVVTEFATGGDRVIVALGQALLGPELAIEGGVRTWLFQRGPGL